MKYIDIDRLLNIDDRRRLEPVLDRLETFVRAVPVQPDRGAAAVPTDLSRYFNRGRLLLERYALIKRLLAHDAADRSRAARRRSTLDDLWDMLPRPTPDITLRLEPFCRLLVRLLSGADWSDKVLIDFFGMFRPKDGNRVTTILPPAGSSPAMNSFFHTIRPLRNIVGHGSGDISVDDTSLMFNLAFLYLAGRFAVELEQTLLTDADYIEYSDNDIPADSEEYDAARSYGRDAVPERQRVLARATLSSRFAATVLATDADLALKLPVIGSEPPIAAQGVTYLIGEKGSGKSTRLACMMLTKPPRDLTLYIVRGETGLQGAPDTWLRERFMAGDFASLTPRAHYARLRWLDKAIAENRVAIIFDACATPRSMCTLIDGISRTYPSVKCIVAAEPTDDGQPPVAGASISRMQLPGDEGAHALMRLISTHTKKHADLSHELVAELSALGVNPGRMLPATLTPLLDLLATDATAAAQNYTALTAKLIQQLSTRTDIDDDERTTLMQSPMFAGFADEQTAIRTLAERVHTALYTEADRQKAVGLIAMSGYVAGASRRRTLFEHCHLLRTDVKVAMLATLAAQTMLDRRPDTAHTPLAPHPALGLLASATATIPYVEPGESDHNKAHPEMVFRPAPRYIVSQYILNLLRIYRSLRYDVLSRPGEVRSLLTYAAVCGTDQVLDEIFRPVWLSQWLIPEGEIIPAASITGMASSENDSPLRYMLKGLHHRVAFGTRLFGAMTRLTAAGAGDRCRKHIDKTLVELVERMTDRMRLDLLHAIKDSQAVDPTLLRRICNRIILQMDVPTASLFYSTDVPLLLPCPLAEVLAKFVKYLHTTPLLLKVAAQVARWMPDKLGEVYAAMVDGDIYSSRYSRAFWKATESLMDERVCAGHIARELRRVPFADLSDRMAMRLYPPHVADFMLHRRDTVDRVRTRVVPCRIDIPEPSMLMPMSPFPGPKTKVNYVAYTVYTRESPSRIVLATEAVPDTVEGRFVRFDGGLVARVIDVIQPRIDSHATAYADITILMPAAVGLPHRGTASLALVGSDPMPMPYIAAFVREGLRAIILRVDDPAVVELLAEATDASGTVIVNSVKAQVAEVRIVPFAPKQTMLVVAPFRDKKGGDTPDIPRSGRLIFTYSSKPDDRKAQGGIFVPLVDSASRAPVQSIGGVLCCGQADDGILLWGAGQPVSRGVLLRHDASDALFRVMACYVLANKEHVPADVATAFYSSLKMSAKKGVKAPYCSVVLQVKVLAGNPVAAAKGDIITDPFTLHWYQPVVAPSTELWRPNIEPPLSFGVFGVRALIEGDKWYLSIPYVPAMKDVKFFRLEGVDMLFSTKVLANGRIPMPPELRLYVGENTHQTYFVRLYNADRATMRFDLDSVAPLLGAVTSRTCPPEMLEVVRPYLCRDAESLRQSFKLFVAAGRLAEWCLMAAAGPSDADFSGLDFPLGVVRVVREQEGRSLVSEVPLADAPDAAPRARWLACEGWTPRPFTIGVIRGNSFDKLSRKAADWLRTRGLGGFRHGTLIDFNGRELVSAGDGLTLPIPPGVNTKLIPVGSPVSYLVTYDNGTPTATNLQLLSPKP